MEYFLQVRAKPLTERGLDTSDPNINMCGYCAVLYQVTLDVLGFVLASLLKDPIWCPMMIEIEIPTF